MKHFSFSSYLYLFDKIFSNYDSKTKKEAEGTMTSCLKCQGLKITRQ